MAGNERQRKSPGGVGCLGGPEQPACVCVCVSKRASLGCPTRQAWSLLAGLLQGPLPYRGLHTTPQGCVTWAVSLHGLSRWVVMGCNTGWGGA